MRNEARQLGGIKDAVLDVMLELVVVLPGVALVAHLRDNAVLPLRRHQELALLERMRKRLLGEDRDPALHRRHQRREVREVRRADRDRVDSPRHRVQHLAEVREPRQIRIELERLDALRTLEIRVAERDDLGKPRVPEVVDDSPGPVAEADVREPHLLAPKRLAPDVREHTCGQSRLQERPSRNVRHLIILLDG